MTAPRLTRCLVLEPTDAIKAKYDKPFELAYVVTLAEHQISTDLHVKNTGSSASSPLEFQAHGPHRLVQVTRCGIVPDRMPKKNCRGQVLRPQRQVGGASEVTEVSNNKLCKRSVDSER